MRNQKTPEAKLSLILVFLSKYIKDKIEKADVDQNFTAAKAYLY